MRYQCMFLVLVLMFSFSSAVFSQSLEEIVEKSHPQNQPLVEQRSDQAHFDAMVRSFVDIMPVSPLGLPAFDRLVSFLRTMLRKIIISITEIDMEPYRPASGPAAVAAGQSGAGQTADPRVQGGKPGADQVTEPSVPGSTTTWPSAGSQVPAGAGGVTGSAFMRQTESMTPAQREAAIIKEILAGNIPSFLRNFKEIEVTQKLKDGKTHSIRYQVMPDYLAIGTDADFVRMPMSPLAAQVIAERFNCILPTTKMVDDIYLRAQTKMLPQPMSGGKYPNWQARMTKNEFYTEHQRLVEGQCRQRGHQNGMLLAGHKKDVVISNHLNSHQKNVVIYGWHDARNGGKPIQGYGWGHENTYADYSHGIRLISNQVMIDGMPMNIKDVLADSTLSALLSKEGPVKNTSARR